MSLREYPFKYFITLFLFLLCLTVLVIFLFSSLRSEKAPPLPDKPSYRDKNIPIDDRITDLLSYMTLEEKVGQMALVDKNSIKNIRDVEKYGLGALLSGFGAKPESNTINGWREMVSNFTETSRRSRLGIPILYGVDATHGHSNVPGATIFPHFIGLGATRDPILVEKIAQATAQELHATNVTWSFSPTLDMPRDIRWGRTYETFSDDPKITTLLGNAYIKGLQRENILSTAKHFVGVGGMLWKSSSNKNFKIDQGTTVTDEEKLVNEYLPPFQGAVASGVGSVMVGLNSWGDTKLSANHYLITDVLKTSLGFKGFTVSDWYGVYEITDNDYQSAVIAINAGIDMVMLPFDYKDFIKNVTKAVHRGEISEARINDAVRRILYAKFSLGLFDAADALTNAEDVGSMAHRALAREAVSKSLVLLKNEDSVLPIPPDVKTIRVAGSAADNIGMQAGAWTVEWQGIDGNWLPGATSILEGIRQRAHSNTKIEYEVSGNFSSSEGLADLGIAIVGEKPYAEGWGDKEYPVLDSADLEAIKKLQAVSKKIVVIIISGRPLLITNEIPSWDAVVAAWLPGSEGEGVADVLFGDVPFTGRLPLPWPHHSEQLPITLNEKTSDNTPLLFPRNFGLR